MNEEMKEHINALSMMLAQEGAGDKIIVDVTGGLLLSITDQEFNFKSTGLACDRIIQNMDKTKNKGGDDVNESVPKETRRVFEGLSFQYPPVSKEEYEQAYEEYIKRCTA